MPKDGLYLQSVGVSNKLELHTRNLPLLVRHAVCTICGRECIYADSTMTLYTMQYSIMREYMCAACTACETVHVCNVY